MSKLAEKLKNKKYRDAYLSSAVRKFLASQIKSMRGDMSQKQFGKRIEKPQSVVSRLEDPDYGKLTIKTLIDIASKMDVALTVRFVDFNTFLKVENNFSEEALRPETFSQTKIDQAGPVKSSGYTYSSSRNFWLTHVSSEKVTSEEPASQKSAGTKYPGYPTFDKQEINSAANVVKPSAGMSLLQPSVTSFANASLTERRQWN